MVRISKETTTEYQRMLTEMTMLQLRMELLTLQDLVRQLDSDHSYFFSSEYAAFIKTERKAVDG
jgi:hypothetical protein